MLACDTQLNVPLSGKNACYTFNRLNKCLQDFGGQAQPFIVFGSSGQKDFSSFPNFTQCTSTFRTANLISPLRVSTVFWPISRLYIAMHNNARCCKNMGKFWNFNHLSTSHLNCLPSFQLRFRCSTRLWNELPGDVCTYPMIGSFLCKFW